MRWLLFFLFGHFLVAQNLVKNPSFEEYVECPNSLGTFNVHVKNWSTPTSGTTDYFNSCSKVMGAPENFNGVQHPKFGNAYAGIYFYAPADYREYVQVALKRMLEKGRNYELVFYISLAEGSDFAVKDFGVLFSYKPLVIETKKNLTKGQLYRVDGNRHHTFEINHPTFHEDKTDWLQVKANFTAKGYEKYLILGNLRDNATTRKVKTKRRESKKGAYYYIDMVSLLADAGEMEDVAQKFEMNKKYVFENIHFEFDTFVLDETAKQDLAKLYREIQQIPNLKLVIHGHTDSQGRLNYNTELSKKRAKTIVDHLLVLGLDSKSITWKGHGSAKPLADNITEEGRRQNRRAEFEIIQE